MYVNRCTKRALNILEPFDWGISAPLTTPKRHPRKTEKAKRSKNDTSCHPCHKSSSPGCRRCFLFSGWLCPYRRSGLPILGWSMQWSNQWPRQSLPLKIKISIGNPKTKTTNWSWTKAKITWRRFLLWWTEVSSGNSTRRALSWFLYLVSRSSGEICNCRLIPPHGPCVVVEKSCHSWISTTSHPVHASMASLSFLFIQKIL